MGENLAEEVKQFMKEFEIGEDAVLHMVGHSLGGIIIRAALPLLGKYRLGTYVSFSSPHLGYLYGTKPYI
jgi:pimeloyl-ACP methyl ester carboxylesterase